MTTPPQLKRSAVPGNGWSDQRVVIAHLTADEWAMVQHYRRRLAAASLAPDLAAGLAVAYQLDPTGETSSPAASVVPAPFAQASSAAPSAPHRPAADPPASDR